MNKKEDTGEEKVGFQLLAIAMVLFVGTGIIHIVWNYVITNLFDIQDISLCKAAIFCMLLFAAFRTVEYLIRGK